MIEFALVDDARVLKLEISRQYPYYVLYDNKRNDISDSSHDMEPGEHRDWFDERPDMPVMIEERDWYYLLRFHNAEDALAYSLKWGNRVHTEEHVYNRRN